MSTRGRVQKVTVLDEDGNTIEVEAIEPAAVGGRPIQHALDDTEGEADLVSRAGAMTLQGFDQRQIAQVLGRSQAWISNRLVSERQRWMIQDQRDEIQKRAEMGALYQIVLREAFVQYAEAASKEASYRDRMACLQRVLDAADRLCALYDLPSIAKSKPRKPAVALTSGAGDVPGSVPAAGNDRATASALLDVVRRTLADRKRATH